jgi:predicted ATPase/DNA-binding SARP family transcriptional activator
VEFRILGRLEAVAAHGPVTLETPKHRALLAILLLHANEVVSADTLVEGLWGERPPATAAKLVQVYVSQLRRALGEDGAIATRAPGYVLAVEPHELDSARFERLLAEGRAALAAGNALLARRALGEALDLWRGPALAEFVYEEFAGAEAERLEELRRAALEERLEADLELGRHEQLIAELQALVEREPLRERAWRQLMLALYRCGRQAEALECFAEARRTLLDELGLEPGDEMRQLQAAILRQDAELAAPVQADAPRTNVPAALVPLLGRERELAELAELLRRDDTRLLTLTGAGGSGKTTLALAVARALVDHFANGAFLVELAPLRDAALVPAAVAATLGADAAPGESPQQAVVRRLRSQELLLVVDNVEHLSDVGPLLVELLHAAPALTLLVTSRTVLHLSGERVYPVAPLEPTPATELFLSRARAADPRFDPTDDEAALAAEICERLDRLPLAIELAAPYVRTLTVEALRDRLAQRLPLAGGPRDLPARQQTLAATIDWSYELLEADEQRVLRGLSVFAGGFTVEAAEAVTGADLATLGTLVEQSLVRRDEDRRLVLLETVREYALDRLEEDADEAQDVRRRHAEFFLAVAESANLNAGKLAPGGQHDEIANAEQDNLRAALAWALASGSVAHGLALANALEQFWVSHDPREGERWFDALLGHPEADAVPLDLRANALRSWGSSSFIAGDAETAETLWQQSLALFEQLGDEHGRAVLLHRLGISAEVRGDLDLARELVEASHEIHASNDDPWARAWGLTQTTGTLGAIARDAGEDERAYELITGSAALARETSVWWEGGALGELAALALYAGRVDEAAEHARASLAIAQEVRSRAGRVFGVALLAWVAAARGERELAGRLWGAIDDEDAAAPLGGWRRHRPACTAAMDEVAGEEFERGRAAGHPLTLDAAAVLALETQPAAPAGALPHEASGPMGTK